MRNCLSLVKVVGIGERPMACGQTVAMIWLRTMAVALRSLERMVFL